MRSSSNRFCRMRAVIYTICTATIVRGINLAILKKRKLGETELVETIADTTPGLVEYIAETTTEPTMVHSETTPSPVEQSNANLAAFLGHSVPAWFHEALVTYVDRGATDQAIFESAVNILATTMTKSQAVEIANTWILMCIVPLKLHARGVLDRIPCAQEGATMVLSNDYKRSLFDVRFADSVPRSPLLINRDRLTTAQITASVVLNDLSQDQFTLVNRALGIVKRSNYSAVQGTVRNFVFISKSLSSVHLSDFLEIVDVIGTNRDPVMAIQVSPYARDLKLNQLQMWKQVHGEALMDFYRDPLSTVRPISLSQDHTVGMRAEFYPILIRKLHTWFPSS